MLRIIYHNDCDGRLAGEIVRRHFLDKYEEIDLIEMDYTKKFPFEVIEKDDVVYMVDFCLQPFSDMVKLNKMCELHFIDHHKSAIKDHDENYKMEIILGVRSPLKAACELVWEHLKPNTVTPMAVQYISDFDSWQFKFGDDTKFFHNGLEMYDYHPKAEIWDKLFDEDNNDTLIQLILNDGAAIDIYKKKYNKEVIDAFGFYVNFEGYKCIACNQGRASSFLFESIDPESYDIMIPFIYNGKEWRVSLYSTKVDVSVIAKKYGGGGHKGAAGMELPNSKFMELFNAQKERDL